MILVLNSGSSSIKYKIFDYNLKVVYSGIKDEVSNHKKALDDIFDFIISKGVISSFEDIKIVGHRVVHGGEYFTNSVVIDDNVIDTIDKLSSIAPLHNPHNLAGIKAIKDISNNITQIAVFDTSFHQTIPDIASLYPIDYDITHKYHIKKYGFHGTSHRYISLKAKEILGISNPNFITLHLGNGASACAIKDGKSIDTSMGFTPLEGLMMGTRCGDIDSSIVLYLQKLRYNSDDIDKLLNKQSGFLGICGKSDLREIEKDALNSDRVSILAIDMFVYRVIKYIGAYMMVLGDIDAIVLSGGIGENSKLIKDKISSYTDRFNLKLLVIKTDEELAIAKDCLDITNM
jgi:acetate kinase